MDYTIQHREDLKIVIATASGEWHRNTELAMVREIMELVDASGSRKVLVDIRELHIDLPIIQIYELARELREQRGGVERASTRVALVYSAKDKKLEEDMNFFETAARNRGLPYRTFKDIEDAMAWLAEE